VLLRKIDRDRIGVEAVIRSEVTQILMGDSGSAADIQDDVARLRFQIAIKRCPVDAADHQRADAVVDERKAEHALIEGH
jgi:hypothetical protein